MSTIVIFALAAAGTYLLRSLVVFGSAIGAGQSMRGTSIDLVSPAVLGAIVVSALFVDESGPTTADPAALLAVAGAVLAARRTNNAGTALLVGLPLYWVAALVGIS